MEAERRHCKITGKALLIHISVWLLWNCTLILTLLTDTCTKTTFLSHPLDEPFLLSSVQTDLYMYGLRSGSLDVLASSAKRAILSLDYDWREQKVFWVSLDTDTIRWSSLDQKTTGILIRGLRHISSSIGIIHCHV